MTAKVIFACVGCAAVGFVAGWGARALVKKKNEELANGDNPKVKISLDEDETKLVDNLYRKRYGHSIFSDSEKDAIEQANAESEAPSEKDYEEGDPETDPDYADDYSSSSYDPSDDYDDYRPRYDQYANDEDEEIDEEEPEVRKKNIWPYEIDAEEFEEYNGFSKSTLEYYKNNVLIDEDGSEITNPGSIIGSGVLKNLLVSKDVAYVRNENLEIDYEIVYVGENYERYDDED